MSEWVSELAGRLIVSRKRDGRCVYDAQAKQELIEACRRPDISMAKLARDCGINANLLNTLVRKHERKAVALSMPAAAEADAATPAFVPVRIEAPAPVQAAVQLQARLAGTSRVTINAWIKAGRCIGVSNLRRGFKLPRWQFEPTVWPLLQSLAKSLGTSDGSQFLSFLETPSMALDGQTPRTALEQGVPNERILALATAEAH